MHNKINKALLNTLAYSDVFSCPLTLDEIHSYLYKYKLSKEKLHLYLENISFVSNVSGYYVLAGRESIVKDHLIKREISEEKLKSIRKVVKILTLIPSISLVSVSGSVAASSADKNSDIDLFIITKPNTLWATRLVATLLLKILGKKRSPLITFAPDSICTNMWMSSDNLKLPIKSIFHAREVVQMKVLFERDNQHRDFISANLWVTKYFPNYSFKRKKNDRYKVKTSFIWRVINFFAFKIQMRYMQKKLTTEKVEYNYAAFHPRDLSETIIELYGQRVKLYESLFYKLLNLENGEEKNVVQDKAYITRGS